MEGSGWREGGRGGEQEKKEEEETEEEEAGVGTCLKDSVIWGGEAKTTT